MEIVIKIPDEEYRLIIQSDKTVFADVASKECMLHAIKNGTPLPVHHGRLIDADKFQMYCFQKNFDRRLSEGGLATINMFLELQPTVVEANKEGEE